MDRLAHGVTGIRVVTMMRPLRRPAEEPHPAKVADDSTLTEAAMDVWAASTATAA